MTSNITSSTGEVVRTTAKTKVRRADDEERKARRQRQQLVRQSMTAFPNCRYYQDALKILASCTHKELVLDTSRRGALTYGCVPCMDLYTQLHKTVYGETTMDHLRWPWLLEASIRGSWSCMFHVIHLCHNKSRKIRAHALSNYWMNIRYSLHSNINATTKEKRNVIKKQSCWEQCCVCQKTEFEMEDDDDEDGDDNESNDTTDDDDVPQIVPQMNPIKKIKQGNWVKKKLKKFRKKITAGQQQQQPAREQRIIKQNHSSPTLKFIQCKGCRYYSYCSKDCQEQHWNHHRGECKQLQILHKYHKPYATQIHQAILRGVDPKMIPELQTLRYKLGLNRPTEEYEGLISFLEEMKEDVNDTNENGITEEDPVRSCLPGWNKDGKVLIGSTPNII